ncbi:tyrosine-type recombinase/integrase [Guptibacillus hwajinpoensis]|uniref:tyrosine-type recombinase/integrase n=1 Tax=Guptibacillus hwajinpoensis TaxID=208199 RepID=UPI001CFDFD18|nr:site-specific integrase [Pseudalkalibacillus hwajinpoensis]WLR60166.1 site-specific integrase [Pseudalkalibacillus hwajinpoensis]
MALKKNSLPKRDSLDSKILELLSNYSIEEINESLNGEQSRLKVSDKLTPTIEEVFNSYFTGGWFKSHAKSTQRTYKVEGELFLKFCDTNFAERRTVKIEKAFNLVTLVNYLSQCKTVATRNKKAAFLRAVIRCECEEYLDNKMYRTLIGQNQKKHSPLQISQPDFTPSFYFKNELEEMFALSRQSLSGMRNYAILNVFIGSGIRLDEINFTVNDVKPRENVIMVRPKGRKGIKVKRYMNQKQMKVLSDYILFKYGGNAFVSEEHKDYFVFSSNKNHGKPLDSSTISKMVKSIVNQASKITIDRKKMLSVHSFRHTFAVSLLHGGVDVYTIQKLLGHSSISATEKYLQLMESQLIQAVEKLPDFEAYSGKEG